MSVVGTDPWCCAQPYGARRASDGAVVFGGGYGSTPGVASGHGVKRLWHTYQFDVRSPQGAHGGGSRAPVASGLTPTHLSAATAATCKVLLVSDERASSSSSWCVAGATVLRAAMVDEPASGGGRGCPTLGVQIDRYYGPCPPSVRGILSRHAIDQPSGAAARFAALLVLGEECLVQDAQATLNDRLFLANCDTPAFRQELGRRHHDNRDAEELARRSLEAAFGDATPFGRLREGAARSRARGESRATPLHARSRCHSARLYNSNNAVLAVAAAL